MKSYLVSVILTSISIGLCEILVPKHNGIEKMVKFIGMLIVLTVIITPVANVITNLDDKMFDDLKEELMRPSEDELNDYNSLLKDYLNNYSIDAIKDKTKEVLSEQFGIPYDECDIKIHTISANDRLSIKGIKILLRGNSIFKNPYNIEDYIGNLFQTKCEVLIDVKGGKDEG